MAYLGWGNSIQKTYRLYNKHLVSYNQYKSDNYSLVKTWLITNYGGSSRIVGDIINNISRKSKPVVGNRKEKFVFYSLISGVKYIDRAELETCLLSGSTLSSLVRLLPTSEYNLWV